MSPTLIMYFAKIQAQAAVIQGMVAANQQRAYAGDSPAYSEDHFYSAANDLEALAQAAGSLVS